MFEKNKIQNKTSFSISQKLEFVHPNRFNIIIIFFGYAILLSLMHCLVTSLLQIAHLKDSSFFFKKKKDKVILDRTTAHSQYKVGT